MDTRVLVAAGDNPISYNTSRVQDAAAFRRVVEWDFTGVDGVVYPVRRGAGSSFGNEGTSGPGLALREAVPVAILQLLAAILVISGSTCLTAAYRI